METLHYGEHREQFGRLSRPDGEQFLPVLVVIHGGYWKDNHSLDSYATCSIADYFSDGDVAVWNLEYRRMGVEGENTQAPWPTVFEDVAAGIDFLRTIAIEKKLDLNRVLVVGHSAGGHLAVWAASRENVPMDSPLHTADPVLPTRTVSAAGILDLERSQDLSQPEQIPRLMGGTPQSHPERYKACNPAQLMDHSRVITIVQGMKDADVCSQQASAYLARSSNPNLRAIFLEGSDHFGMLPLDGIEPPDWSIFVDILRREIELL